MCEKLQKKKPCGELCFNIKNAENYELVKEAFLLAGRKDLIGFDKKCLMRPRGTARKSRIKKPVAKKRNLFQNIHKRKGWMDENCSDYGASSGMGKAFTRQIAEKYQELDEIWIIARKKEGLEKLRKEIPKLHICLWI